MQISLRRSGHPLADSRYQLQVLSSRSAGAFSARIAAAGLPTLTASRIQILQMNLGKLCNQTCRHCHVDAGPDRREVMSESTVDACLRVLQSQPIPTLDLTGGAPEMNPQFRRCVQTARAQGRHVIDRCNLTILMVPGYEDLVDFLAGEQVEIVASLPCYLEENTDKQRGDGVFAKSIAALKKLNQAGFGCSGSGLTLTLVFNPVGAKLPPPQVKLEDAYRHELQSRYGIVFTRLLTITNMPISRFLADLMQTGQDEQYLQLLRDSFNPQTVSGLMCRNTLSVGWDGKLYDCDFNQMLDLPVATPKVRTIFDFDAETLEGRPIVTDEHCFGCTAGAGSGCQGQVVAAGR